jgi:CDP-diacylglycerol--glycerol-3-phosphate 3-phosphatidyltransferase
VDERYVAQWSQLHGGYDVARSRLVTAWVSGCHALARPLALRAVPPLAVTIAAPPVAAAACVLAGGGRAERAASVLLVVVAAVLDGVDGALAIVGRRVSRLGFLADSLVDRVVDALLLVALWQAGAVVWSVVVAGAALLMFEYARARAGAAGMTEIGVVTVGERPVRVVVAAAGLLATVAAPGHVSAAATAASLATGGLSIAALTQFLAVARHALAE